MFLLGPGPGPGAGVRLLLCVGLVLALAAPAGAASFTTLDPTVPVPFDNGSLSGSIDPVDTSTLDKGDIVCLAGDCDAFSALEFIIFEVSVTSVNVPAGDLEALGVTLFYDTTAGGGFDLPQALGIGFFDEGTDPPDSGDSTTGSIAIPTAPRFTFDPDLSPTTTTEPLFITFPVGTVAGSLASSFDGQINFMLREAGEAADFGAQGRIPEPGTLVLLGSALAGLAAWRRVRH